MLNAQQSIGKERQNYREANINDEVSISADSTAPSVHVPLVSIPEAKMYPFICSLT